MRTEAPGADHRRWRLAIGLAGLLLVASCGPSYRGAPLHGAFQPDDPELVLGQRVFFVHCHACHPGGDAGLGFALNDKPLPGWLIRLQVRTGLGAMPRFPVEEIDDMELDALVAYLQALRRHGASTSSTPTRPTRALRVRVGTFPTEPHKLLPTESETDRP